MRRCLLCGESIEPGEVDQDELVGASVEFRAGPTLRFGWTFGGNVHSACAVRGMDTSTRERGWFNLGSGEG